MLILQDKHINRHNQPLLPLLMLEQTLYVERTLLFAVAAADLWETM